MTDVLSAIGNTSLVRLRCVVPDGCAEVWAKLEGENPTGGRTTKALILAMIEAARARRLPPESAVLGGGAPAPRDRSAQPNPDRPQDVETSG